MREAVSASPEHPVLIDRFLKDAIEVDLDLVADRTGAVLVGGVHGAHRGGGRALGRRRLRRCRRTRCRRIWSSG